MLDYMKNDAAPTDTDGLIIVAGNETYMSGTKKGFPSNVKWKPLNKFTIDFAVYHGDEDVPHVLKIAKGKEENRSYDEFFAPQFDPTKV